MFISLRKYSKMVCLLFYFSFPFVFRGSNTLMVYVFFSPFVLWKFGKLAYHFSTLVLLEADRLHSLNITTTHIWVFAFHIISKICPNQSSLWFVGFFPASIKATTKLSDTNRIWTQKMHRYLTPKIHVIFWDKPPFSNPSCKLPNSIYLYLVWTLLSFWPLHEL
jgi:hypothetical protein